MTRERVTYSGYRQLTVEADGPPDRLTLTITPTPSSYHSASATASLNAEDRKWLIRALQNYDKPDTIPGGFKLGDIVQHTVGFVGVVSSNDYVTSDPDRYVPVKVLADFKGHRRGDTNGYTPDVLSKIEVTA